MTLSAILLSACAGNETAKIWAALPVSESVDAEQLAAQIKANPSAWKAAAEFLTGNDLSAIALGRHELAPDGTYANVQEYTTKENSKYEVHRAYIDIQVVVSGREQILVSPLGALQDCLQEYDPEKDIEFFAASSEFRSVPADAGHWVILFPSDAHEPCITLGEPSEIRKVVVKVPFINL